VPGPKSHLDDKGFCESLARLLVDGKSRDEIADILGCNRYSITKWRKDPRVKAPMLRLAQERTLRVTRLTDSILEGRLSRPEDLTVKELLAIRSAFSGSDLFKKSQEQSDESDNVADILEFFEEDPEKAKQLADALNL
jgi:hypothetical protein